MRGDPQTQTLIIHIYHTDPHHHDHHSSAEVVVGTLGDTHHHPHPHHHGVHPNSHKHFIPYMGFCASIWDSVRHHCHHHHHHHDHQK